MGMREDFGSFDLGRLTIVGWLVFLLSIGAGIGAAILVGTYWDSMFPPRPGSNPQNRGGPAGIAGFGGAVGFFFAAKLLLSLAGITMMRPKANPPGNNESQDKAKGSRS